MNEIKKRKDKEKSVEERKKIKPQGFKKEKS